MEGLAICLDGVEDDRLVAAAAPWAPRFAWVEVWCAYGDEAERELRHVREHHGRPHHDKHDHLDREQAQSIAERGVELLAKANLSARPRTLAGRDPGHALAEASDRNVVLFLLAGHSSGTGPHSVGHVARFVIDHASGPIIVTRLG